MLRPDFGWHAVISLLELKNPQRSTVRVVLSTHGSELTDAVLQRMKEEPLWVQSTLELRTPSNHAGCLPWYPHHSTPQVIFLATSLLQTYVILRLLLEGADRVRITCAFRCL